MPETNICKYYPHWFRRILDFQALCYTEKQELQFLAEAMDQIHKNLFVQTMDEGTTALWEEILRILPLPGEDLDFRRLRVLNRLALHPPFTLIFLREKLDLIFGQGNYTIEIDYPNYTLYIESSVENQQYFSEVSALLNIIKPCHIVYVSRPRIDGALSMGERAERVKYQYNYILGQWELGRKPFVSFWEQEVYKLENTHSIEDLFLEQTAEFTSQDVAAARVNGSTVIDRLIRTAVGNVGSVTYTVHRSQAESVELVELLDKRGGVLTVSRIHAPVLEDAMSLRHSFRIREMGGGDEGRPKSFHLDPNTGMLSMQVEEPYFGPQFKVNSDGDLEVTM